MENKKSKPSLIDLLDDMLGVIHGKVGDSSLPHLVSCNLTCKTFQKISKYPDVLQKLNLDKTFPPPWERKPVNTELLYECAKYGNVHALFLCGLIDYYFLKQSVTGSRQLKLAAEANHPEAMYLYGMLLINENQLTEGSNYIKKLWKEKGFGVVRQCQQNCSPVVLEMSVRQCRDYDMLLSQIEVPDDCVIGQFEDVCENCMIYKEIFRFIDYMHYV